MGIIILILYFRALLEKGDLITGFTPLHFALFTENAEIIAFLIRYVDFIDLT